MQLDLPEIIGMTAEFGEGWALPHARRVLALAHQIAGDLQPDWLALEYAAYLHDWGAFKRYALPGVDHAQRSRQVAESEVLPHTNLDDVVQTRILVAIALHDYRNPLPVQSPEALVLREADFLDFLGVIGMAREFAWGPNNLVTCRARILQRREGIAGRFTLPAAQALAEQRLARMAQVLEWLDEESVGSL